MLVRDSYEHLYEEKTNRRFSWGCLFRGVYNQGLVGVSAFESMVMKSSSEVALMFPAVLKGRPQCIIEVEGKGEGEGGIIVADSGAPTNLPVIVFQSPGCEAMGCWYSQERSMFFAVWPKGVWGHVRRAAVEEKLVLIPQADGPRTDWALSNGGTQGGRCDAGNDMQVNLGVTCEIVDHCMRGLSNLELSLQAFNNWGYVFGRNTLPKARELFETNVGPKGQVGAWRDIRAAKSLCALATFTSPIGWLYRIRLPRALTEGLSKGRVLPCEESKVWEGQDVPGWDHNAQHVEDCAAWGRVKSEENVRGLIARIEKELASNTAVAQGWRCGGCGGVMRLYDLTRGVCEECEMRRSSRVGGRLAGHAESIEATDVDDEDARHELAEQLGLRESQIVCRHCGDTLFSTHFEVVRGEAIHEDCMRSAGYAWCSWCEEWVDEDSINYYERADESLCSSCADSLTHWQREDEGWERCPDCDEEYDSFEEGEDGYCGECRWNHVDMSDEDAARRCEECGNVFIPSRNYDWDSIIEDVSAEGIDKIEEMYRTLCGACGQERIDNLRIEYRVQPESASEDEESVEAARQSAQSAQESVAIAGDGSEAGASGTIG